MNKEIIKQTLYKYTPEELAKELGIKGKITFVYSGMDYIEITVEEWSTLNHYKQQQKKSILEPVRDA